MAYTVKRLADLAGVSVRTLHYYDQIGLLQPTTYGENRYRYYGEEALLRLQQILLYKELGLSLGEIREIMDRPDFDVLRALEAHKVKLRQRIERLGRLIDTVDETILYKKGKVKMEHKKLFEPFSEEQQQKYEQEARQRWGDEQVGESVKRWNRYTAEEKKKIGENAERVIGGIIANMDKGYDSAVIQRYIREWHQHIGYYYDCSYEIFEGLGHGYNQDPAFHATFHKMHPDLPAFLENAMTYYCQQHANPA